MAAPLLTIEDPSDPPVVTIFGSAYPVRTPEQRSYEETMRIAQLHKTKGAGFAGEVTEEKLARLAAYMREIAGFILPTCPAEVLDSLTDGQRVQLVETFNSRYGSGGVPQ